jgi:hypothetical protein
MGRPRTDPGTLFLPFPLARSAATAVDLARQSSCLRELSREFVQRSTPTGGVAGSPGRSRPGVGRGSKRTRQLLLQTPRLPPSTIDEGVDLTALVLFPVPEAGAVVLDVGPTSAGRCVVHVRSVHATRHGFRGRTPLGRFSWPLTLGTGGCRVDVYGEQERSGFRASVRDSSAAATRRRPC